MFQPGDNTSEYEASVPVEYPITGDVVTLLDSFDAIQKPDPALGRK
jgi:hypothetical protein